MGYSGASVVGEQWWSTAGINARCPTDPTSVLEAMGNVTSTGAGLNAQRSWLIDHGYDLRSSSILAASGIALAIHFAARTWSTIPPRHSLLVTSHPIVIVSFMVPMMRRMDWLLVSGALLDSEALPRTPRCIPDR